MLHRRRRHGPGAAGFRDCHALQCGFCTPGFITTITAYLEENPAPTAEEAREAISGNLCRCTGYQNIVAAVLRAGELIAERTDGSGATVDGSGGRREAPDGFGAPGPSGSSPGGGDEA